MIQRIQSLYLLVISALMAVTLFVPLAWFAYNEDAFVLWAFALREINGTVFLATYCLGGLLAASCVLPLVTIFLFRRRMLQIRLCVVEGILLLGAILAEGLCYAMCYKVFREFSFFEHAPRPAIALPVVCLVFAWLAARAIFRDELLVRAADRIR